MAGEKWLYALSLMALFTALWFSQGAAFKLYIYYKLSSNTVANEVTWKQITVNDERYLLHASYSYTLGNTSYSGETTIPKPFYRNPWAAEQAIQEAKGNKWRVWYSPDDYSFSSLYRFFPLKEMIYSGIMWSLALYFCFLGRRLTNYL